MSYKIAEEIYKQQGASGQQGDPGAGMGAGPDMGGFNPNMGADPSGASNTKSAEDADYEVVDDEK